MRRRLVWVAVATAALVVVAFVIPLALLVRSVAAEQVLSTAEVAAQSLAPVVATADADAVEPAMRLATSHTDGPMTVVFADGRTIGDTAPVPAAREAARSGRARIVDVEGGRAVLVPVATADGRTAVVQALVSDDALTEGVAAAWLQLGILAVALIAGAGLVAARLGRSTVREVRKLERLARRLGEGDLDAWADVESPPELAAVAEALHGLARRIEELLAAERQAVADVSHRLRTPLTALRLDAEALGPGQDADRVLADVQALDAAIDEVIRLTRRREAAEATTDVAACVRDRIRFWAVLADAQGRAHPVDIDDEAPPAPLPRREVADALDALLDNVFAHTPPGTRFGVVVAALGEGGTCLDVWDDGPGLPVDASKRGRSSGGSTGLGLDIARRAAERSGGRLEIGNGPGGRVRVVFGPVPARPALA